jgi:hypothetical protein
MYYVITGRLARKTDDGSALPEDSNLHTHIETEYEVTEGKPLGALGMMHSGPLYGGVAEPYQWQELIQTDGGQYSQAQLIEKAVEQRKVRAQQKNEAEQAIGRRDSAPGCRR